MKTCSICSMEYQPVITYAEHNAIHIGRMPMYIDLGEGVSPEDVEKFREYWNRAAASQHLADSGR